jgi:mRNA interferase MazF
VSQAISVRLDDEALQALGRLEATGLSRSEAIRVALIQAADRLRDRRRLAQEVAALEADGADRAEMLAVANLMEQLRAAGSRPRAPNPEGVGHEQCGRRFGVVVQSDALLPRSTVLIAPTSKRARPASFRPEIEVGGECTRVLVEQVGAVDGRRLGDLVGRFSPEELWGVGAALLTVLGLD